MWIGVGACSSGMKRVVPCDAAPDHRTHAVSHLAVLLFVAGLARAACQRRRRGPYPGAVIGLRTGVVPGVLAELGLL